MGTSPNRSYPYPAGSDAVDVPGDMEALADAVDTDMAAVIAYDTAYVAKTSAYTLLGTDRVIDVTGTTTITLPAAASHTGRVYTIRNTGTNTVTVSGITGLTLPGKGTAVVVSDGSAWSPIDGTYTDESVGRRIFTWDAVNSRWQMTYGDTGWRAITSFDNSWTGTAYLRRVNNVVSLFVSNGAQLTGGSLNYFLTLPSGFRTAFNGMWGLVKNAGTYRDLYQITNGKVAVDGWSSGDFYILNATWSTAQAWPTSLPGSASGSIPS